MAKRRRRPQLFKNTEAKHQLPPGTPIHIGDSRDFAPVVTQLTFNVDKFTEDKVADLGSIHSQYDSEHVRWIDVEGIHRVNVVKQLCDAFEIHPLTQEDLVNSALRPKFETFPDYFFFTLKMLYLSADQNLRQEHVGLILKGDTVLTFQETPGDVFEVIRERIRHGTGRIRSRGGDYLTYALLDAIVDGYYQVVDHVGEKLEALEEEIRCGPTESQIERIFDIKREILFLRKMIFPVRDMISKMQREAAVFQDTSRIYLKDLADHAQQVSESLTTFTELSAVLLDTYHSMMNQRMNNIMKMLTMMSTVFLPLNFIAGIYGMNFEHMPELHYQASYPIVLLVMLTVALAMVAFFIRKGWLFDSENRRKKKNISA